MKKLIVLLVLIISSYAQAQDTSFKRSTINGGIAISEFGLVLGRLQYDFLLNPRIAIEGDLYFNDGTLFTGGLKFLILPYEHKKLSPYLGLTMGASEGIFVIRFPVGVAMTWKSGFIANLGVGIINVPDFDETEFWPEAMIGYRF